MKRIVSRGIYIKGNTVLLVKSTNKENYFLPGGQIENGESSKIALIREMQEELNKEAIVENFVGIVENMWIDQGVNIHEVNFIFTMKIVSDSPLISIEEYLDFKWVSIKELDNVNILPICMKDIILKVASSSYNAFFFSNY